MNAVIAATRRSKELGEALEKSSSYHPTKGKLEVRTEERKKIKK
jgi:hypothetical protein